MSCSVGGVLPVGEWTGLVSGIKSCSSCCRFQTAGDVDLRRHKNCSTNSYPERQTDWLEMVMLVHFQSVLYRQSLTTPLSSCWNLNASTSNCSVSSWDRGRNRELEPVSWLSNRHLNARQRTFRQDTQTQHRTDRHLNTSAAKHTYEEKFRCVGGQLMVWLNKHVQKGGI